MTFTSVEGVCCRCGRCSSGAVGRLRGELDRWCAVAPAAFASAVGQVSFAVADPAVRAELGAVWVETKDDSLRLVATDSYRLAVRDLVPEEVGPAGIRGVIDAVLNVLALSPFFVLGPVIAKARRSGAPAWSAIALGYVLGNLAAAHLTYHWAPRRPVLTALTVSAGLAPCRDCSPCPGPFG